jgi:zinc protease
MPYLRRPARAWPLLLGLVAGLLPAVLWAQTGAEAPAGELTPDPAVRTGTLDSGITYFVRANQKPEQRAELYLVLNAGSVLEDEDQLGLAHFVEHMAFNGTANFEKQELVDYLESIGMRFGPNVNAFTSFDETVYTLTVPTDDPEIVETAMQILEDWAHQVSFDPEEVDKERGVVIEEWRRGRGAGARMLDEQLPVLFQGSRYAERLPIGSVEVLESFDHEALIRFYQDWYRPDLMAVVAVGDFDEDWMTGLIESHFGALTGPAGPRTRVMHDVPGHTETLYAIATDAEATNSQVAVLWKRPAREEGTVEAYRASVVERLYNGMFNARLFELGQQADPPFAFAGSGTGRFVRTSEFYQLFSLVKEGGTPRGFETLLTEAERVRRHGFTESELERQKIELLRGIERAYADRETRESSSFATEYQRSFLTGEPFPGIEVEYALHQDLMPGITLDEVDALASVWLVDGDRVVLTNSPEKPGLATPTEADLAAIISAVQDSEIGPYEDIATDAPLVAAVPAGGAVEGEEVIEELDVTFWELTNGVRVYLKPTDFDDDQIILQAYSPGGHSLASDDAFQSASQAAVLVSQGGVGAFDIVSLGKKLAGKAAEVRPTIGTLTEGMTGSASPKDVQTMFELAYLYFTEPRKDDGAFQSFRTRMQAFLANRTASPEAAFTDTLTVTLSQDHFRAQPPSLEMLDEIDLEVGYDFYLDRFADASDFTFVLVGAFDVDEIRPLVETYLGGLPDIDRDESWRDVGIEAPSGVIEKVVRRGVEPKSQTRIVFTGPEAWTPESSAALGALGDVLSIKLRERLREDLGGTYTVSAGGGILRQPREEYQFSVSFGADPDRLEDLVAVAWQEIERIQNEGPTAEDIEKVRETQRRSKETSLERNGWWAGRIMRADRYGDDLEEIPSFELIDGITGAMVQEAAQRYLRRDNYVRVSLYPAEPIP